MLLPLRTPLLISGESQTTPESMAKLTDYTRYADAQAHANSAALWDLFDGNREFFNIAHESITRHAEDRKRVVEGTSVSVRVDLGGRRIITKNKKRAVS